MLAVLGIPAPRSQPEQVPLRSSRWSNWLIQQKNQQLLLESHAEHIPPGITDADLFILMGSS